MFGRGKRSGHRRARAQEPQPVASTPGPVFFEGDGFSLSNPERETIVYAEGANRWSLLAGWGVTPPVLGVPRPEVWDHVVAPWLRGRSTEVTRRLVEHSGHRIVYDPDDWYRERLHPLIVGEVTRSGSCTCCDRDDVVTAHASHGDNEAIDIGSTQRAIEQRIADGRFEVIRADVPVEQMLDELERDVMYTIVSYLTCTVSGETVFWGLCIRGDPIYQHVDPVEPFVRRWENGRPQVDRAGVGPA